MGLHSGYHPPPPPLSLTLLPPLPHYHACTTYGALHHTQNQISDTFTVGITHHRHHSHSLYCLRCHTTTHVQRTVPYTSHRTKYLTPSQWVSPTTATTLTHSTASVATLPCMYNVRCPTPHTEPNI